MSTTTVPGSAAVRKTITDECRTNHTDQGALAVALVDLHRMYAQLVDGWKIGDRAKIHIVMTVERPS